MGVLLAMQIVLSRMMNIQLSPSLRLNLGFLPTAVAGMLMGPFCSMLVAVCGDLLGATLFPSGALFPGFTITAALAGINYGLWLYRREPKLWRAALTILPEALRQFADFRMLIYAIVLIFVMLATNNPQAKAFFQKLLPHHRASAEKED